MATSPQLRIERCTRHRYRYSECRRCADACPHDAIGFDAEGPSIDASACRHCALCVAACPSEAWASEKLPHVALVKRALKATERCSFACIPSEAAADSRIPCLGDLDAALLAFITRHGIDVELRGTWHCRDCPQGKRAEAMLDFAAAGLTAIQAMQPEAAFGAVTRTAAPADSTSAKNGFDDSRRAMFRRLFGRSVATALDDAPAAPVADRAVRISPPVSTIRRELLLKLWPAAGEDDIELDDTLPAAAFAVNARCTACELCARVCPGGALAIVENDSQWRLAFTFGRCLGCDVCLEACRPGALQRLSHIAAVAGRQREPATLAARAKRRCARCDRFFLPAAAGDELCPICARDEQDFAEMFG